MKDKGIKWYIVAIVCVSMLAVSSLYYLYTKIEKEEEESMLEQRISMELDSARANLTRPNYLPEVMFSELEEYYPFPKDFYVVRLMYRYGMIQSEAIINESYWKQPEWMEGFEDRYVQELQDYDWHYSEGWRPVTYPKYKVAKGKLDIPPEGIIFESYSWIYSGVTVEGRLGISLEKQYPSYDIAPADPRYGMRKMEVYQNPDDVKGWITFDIEPENAILEPSFPIWDKDYAIMVKMTVTVNGDIPPGKYVIGYDVVAPPDYCIDDEKILGITGDQCDGMDNDGDRMVDESLSTQWMWDYRENYIDPNYGNVVVSAKRHRLFMEIA